MSLKEDPDRPAAPIKIGWVFDVLVPEDAPPTDLAYVSSTHGGFEHHGFEGRTPGNIDSYNSSNGLTRRFRFNMVGGPVNWYPVTLYAACSVVHADGLYEESPVVPASIAGVAQGILAQENPDAAQLRLARKVMELMGDDAPHVIDTDPRPVSVPVGGTATVTVHVYPPGGDQSFTATIKDPTIAGVEPMTAGAAPALTMPTLTAPRLHADTPAETADVEAPFPG